MIRLPRHPAIWFTGLLLWMGVLWFLSSQPGSGKPYPVDHVDKVLHFIYFLCGGIGCAGWLYRLRPEPPNWRRIILLTILLLSAVGVIDEWHQSHTPNRSGNDPGDMMADFLGAVAGAFTFKSLHRRFRWNS
jgi:VanZ family protein